MFLNRPIKEYIIFFSMSFFTVSLSACNDMNSSNKVSLNNKTSYMLYASKYEVKVSDTEITLDEMESAERMVLDVDEKDYYYISNYALLADFPVDIDIGWHVTDEDIEGKPMYKSQGKAFNISEKGFCSYEIDIYDTYTEVKGIEGGSCDKKIILNKKF
ncbi:hypothetical protein [Psychrobacter sp. JCM 18902]|uniref:hypothetical protein n=1 Tax=Psychrobacter sp. JCM 18902 TaxID=1298607 RepID=UPI0005EFEE45|nr:hypothetical protein [Psychrobacter sp. JCM 18902]